MKMTIGNIVYYRLTLDQAYMTNKRREDARQNFPKMREERPGFQAHVGSPVSEGDMVPLVITASLSEDLVNGQAILDGNDTLWVTSATMGTQPGQWSISPGR